MSKTKTTITFTSVFTKIVIGIAAVALVVCIVLLSTKCAKNRTKKDYYECESYQWMYVNGTTPMTINRLEDYEYYRLYLNSDDTFTIKYVLKEDDTERSEGGTYVKSGSTYTLTYRSTPTQELSTVVKYTLEDGKLIREDLAKSPNGIQYTIVQVFSK